MSKLLLDVMKTQRSYLEEAVNEISYAEKVNLRKIPALRNGLNKLNQACVLADTVMDLYKKEYEKSIQNEEECKWKRYY